MRSERGEGGSASPSWLFFLIARRTRPLSRRGALFLSAYTAESAYWVMMLLQHLIVHYCGRQVMQAASFALSWSILNSSALLKGPPTWLKHTPVQFIDIVGFLCGPLISLTINVALALCSSAPQLHRWLNGVEPRRPPGENEPPPYVPKKTSGDTVQCLVSEPHFYPHAYLLSYTYGSSIRENTLIYFTLFGSLM